MIFSETVSYWLMEYCSIHSWQDALEILFFASAIYAASSWLKQDKNNRLLIGFYSYIALFCATYFLIFQLCRIVYFLQHQLLEHYQLFIIKSNYKKTLFLHVARQYIKVKLLHQTGSKAAFVHVL